MTDTPVKKAFDAYILTSEYEDLEDNCQMSEECAFAIFVAGWQAALTKEPE